MASKIPFFDMFSELQSLSELRLKLFGAVLTGARIDQSAMSLLLHLEVKNPLTEEDRQQALSLLNETESWLLSRSDWRQRLRLKYGKCLYA